MSARVAPAEIRVSEASSKGFSPRNYAQVGITRQLVVPLRQFLNPDKPYEKGIEPGSAAYVENSPAALLRNSCVSIEKICCAEANAIPINPRSAVGTNLSNGDLVMCKDANIGEAALFIGSGERSCYLSSGLVKLNLAADANKFYVLANLRDEYFREQLDAVTPRGSTIRHAGDRFLDCKIPQLRKSEAWVNDAFEALCLNIAACESITKIKIETASQQIKQELFVEDISLDFPTVSNFKSAGRLDAGFYSDLVQTIQGHIRLYKHGNKSVEEFGFKVRRGPNLAKRDLGRSIITDQIRSGYEVLIYPSDIAEEGFILRNSFIGARGAIWHLGCGDLLFSAEGTVGRVFAVCDTEMHFTTNFHGIILSHEGQTDLVKTGFLCMYLHFLRMSGFFEKVSVGGQGGSFATQYWGLVRVPIFPSELMNQISSLYTSEIPELHPLTFSKNTIDKAGAYQLSQLRIQASALLKKILSDLKADTLLTKEEYFNLDLTARKSSIPDES